MDNFAPSGPQPIPSPDQTPATSSATLPEDAGSAVGTAAAQPTRPSVAPSAPVAQDVGAKIEEFFHDRPLTCVAVALVSGIGLATLALSLFEAQRRSSYGRWS